MRLADGFDQAEYSRAEWTHVRFVNGRRRRVPVDGPHEGRAGTKLPSMRALSAQRNARRLARSGAA